MAGDSVPLCRATARRTGRLWRDLVVALVLGVLTTSLVGLPALADEARPSDDDEVANTIHAGQPADIADVPFLVSLQLRGFGHICGGTLVHSRWVLTAAHCLYRTATTPTGDREVLRPMSDFVLLLGVDRSAAGWPSGPSRSVTDIVLPLTDQGTPVYEELARGDLRGDWALLELDRHFFGAPPVSLAPTEPSVGSGAVTFGWGSVAADPRVVDLPFGLQRVDTLEISPDPTCAQTPLLYDSHLCTLGIDDANIRPGDSGGPLLQFVDGRWLQVGITSFFVQPLPRVAGWTSTTSPARVVADLEQRMFVTLAGRDTGWVIEGGAKQWLDTTCRRLLEAAGVDFEVVAWNEVSEAAEAPRRDCSDLRPASSVELVVVGTSLTGWWLVDGQRRWLSADCVAEAEAAGARLVVVTWSDIAAVPPASGPFSCTELLDVLGGAPTLRLLTNRESNAAGWIVVDGQKQWIDATCRALLEAQGLIVELMVWTAINEIPDAPRQSCDALVAIAQNQNSTD